MARSSSFHPMQFEMKSMDPKQLYESKMFLEQTFHHTHIRHPLNIEKSEEFLSNEKILLIGSEGRADPGFLCFLPKKPVQFLKCRLDAGFYVRLRVESSLFNNGTVFIASAHLNSITVQDCWMWQGESLQHMPYSKRFSYVQRFLQSYIIQDPRLSGFEVAASKHHTLDSFQELQLSDEYTCIDFIPESPKRRRLFYRLLTKAQEAKPKLQAPQQQQQQQQHQQQQQAVLHKGPLIAFAKNIQGLPDTFDLFSIDKKHIGEAAVQEEDISAALRIKIKSIPSLMVIVEWNDFLDAFEIKQIAPPGSKVLPSHYFMQGSAKKSVNPVESDSESLSHEDSYE